MTAVKFDDTGDYLAVGDKAGRICIFEGHSARQAPPSASPHQSRPPPPTAAFLEYKFYTEFQSHDREFDSLKSVEIEEKINMIQWGRRQSVGMFLLATNDKTIKYWKVHEKKIKRVKNAARTSQYHHEDIVIPRLTHSQTITTATPKRIYANAHEYHINSISMCSDGSGFISADDLRINLWDLTCFPQHDHEVLTSDGFKGFAEFRRALAAGKAVSVACPVRRHPSDPLDQLALEYHDVSGLASLVDKTTTELVEMRGRETVSTRLRGKSKAKRSVQYIHTNHMDLQLTPDHKLPVSLGAYERASHAAAHLMTAQEVVDARRGQEGCGLEGIRQGAQDGAECAGFVCHATHGVSDPAPHLRLPFAVALGLTTEDQIDAFVELYGYWLADGSMDRQAEALTFSAYKDADVVYLDALFSRLPLRHLTGAASPLRQHGYRERDYQPALDDDGDDDDVDDAHVSSDDDGDEVVDASVVTPARVRRQLCQYLIYHPAWFQYFAEQYGHKYWGPEMREAAVRGARRRGSELPLPRYPGFYEPTINDGQPLKEVREKMAREQLTLARTSYSPSTATPLLPAQTSAFTVRSTQLFLSASRTSTQGEGTASSPFDVTLDDDASAHEPKPLDAQDISSAKWAWWWVWARLDACRLRLLLRGLRFADGNQLHELRAEKRKAKMRRSGGGRDDTSRVTGVPLTDANIYTTSARCREEYQHMALRAGFACTTRLKRRVGHTSAAQHATCVRPLWQVSYQAAPGKQRLVINPCDPQVGTKTREQLLHKEIHLRRLDTPKKVWCIGVPTADHLIIVRRVTKRGEHGEPIESSRPTVRAAPRTSAALSPHSALHSASCLMPLTPRCRCVLWWLVQVVGNCNSEAFTIVDLKPANIQELNEVITSATFHPSHCSILVSSSSKGSIRMADLRERALCDQHAKLFEVDSASQRSFFSEITSSISDAIFAGTDGRYIISRDYLTLKVWDVNNEARPLSVIPVHDYLRVHLRDLYDNDCIFDKFNVSASSDATRIVSGSYNNHFLVHNIRTDSNVTLEAARGRVNNPNVTEMDFGKKALHVSWHPKENTLAVAGLNKLYIYSAQPADPNAPPT